MPRDYDAITRALLGPTVDDPAPRARRIAAIYASLYLEDPLLHQWCGLAAFVARQVYKGLETNLLTLQDHFAAGNLAIYSDVVPAFLRFRDHAPVFGPLERGFNALRRADRAARSDLPRARAHAEEGLRELSRVEQALICQPIYDRMGPWQQRGLQPFVLFRLGTDTASPILRFDGKNPGRVEDRLAWVYAEVLPTWTAFSRNEAEMIRADCDRIRREGGARLGTLPEPLPS